MLSLFIRAVAVFLCGISLTAVSFPAYAEKISIVTTSFAQYDLTSHVTGDLADVSMLLKPGADAHSFEPTPADLIKIERSDLFVYNGGENDEWIDKLLSNYPAIRNFAFIKELPLLTEEDKEGMQKEEEEEEHEAGDKVEYDEHVWTSPVNDMRLLNALCNKISAIDPQHADIYRKNADRYIAQFKKLDRQIREIVKNSPSKVLIFADRFPFRYFCNEYGLDYFAAFKGCSDESEVSPATLRFLVNKVNQLKKKVILKIELTSTAPADAVSEATGAKIMIMNSGHNISTEQLAANVSLAELFSQDLQVLKAALK